MKYGRTIRAVGGPFAAVAGVALVGLVVVPLGRLVCILMLWPPDASTHRYCYEQSQLFMVILSGLVFLAVTVGICSVLHLWARHIAAELKADRSDAMRSEKTEHVRGSVSVPDAQGGELSDVGGERSSGDGGQLP